MLKIRFRDARREPLWVVEKTFSIGSAPDNSLVIHDDSVSSYHARLILEDGGFILQDMGSRRGTFVNGHRATNRHLGCNDRIRLGEVELEIVDPFLNTEGKTAPYWALIANSSRLAGQEFPLGTRTDDSLLIGRGSHCDVVFPGTHLSREHTRIKLAADHVLVEDLNSANGTYLNDQRITGTARARAGDRIRLDIYSFTLLGPGIDLPRSAAHPQSNSPASGEAEPPSSRPKKWKTRPTSPGNREEPPSAGSGAPLIWLSLLLIVVLLGGALYLLVS